MDFTREPIVETIITPRDGYRLVVRNTKACGQEEYLVEALEIITFGGASFFRNRERSKAFVVPVSDYEIVEVRDTRIGLKAAFFESVLKPTVARPKQDLAKPKQEKEKGEGTGAPEEKSATEKKRKKSNRRKKKDEEKVPSPQNVEKEIEKQEPGDMSEESIEQESKGTGRLLPPPQTLIKDEIQRLRQNGEYKGAFYVHDDDSSEGDDEPDFSFSVEDDPALYMATPVSDEEPVSLSERENDEG